MYRQLFLIHKLVQTLVSDFLFLGIRSPLRPLMSFLFKKVESLTVIIQKCICSSLCCFSNLVEVLHPALTRARDVLSCVLCLGPCCCLSVAEFATTHVRPYMSERKSSEDDGRSISSVESNHQRRPPKHVVGIDPIFLAVSVCCQCIGMVDMS